MGFTTGFTGGVTLTLSIAYLTLHAHRRNREHQAALLRQQTYLLSSTLDPLPPALPPTRAELAALERANLAEAAKDRWNAEVEAAVRWAQTKDWAEVREGVETALERLWARGFNSGGAGGVGGGDAQIGGLVVNDDDDAKKRKTEGVVASAAKDAYAKATATATTAAVKVEEKAEGAKGSVFGFIGGLFGGGGGSDAKAIGKQVGVDGKTTMPSSPVEKALRQRYEGQAEGLEKSADEILAARYASAGK